MILAHRPFLDLRAVIDVSMGNINTIKLAGARLGWDQIVAAIRSWGDAEHVQWRDAIVLLPFAQLLPLARRAWAKGGGFLPRIETTQTLIRSLAPAPAPSAGQISFDIVTDRLLAARMLDGQPWACSRVARDPLHGEQMVAALVEVAQAIARAAAAVPASRRPEYWQRARVLLAPIDGPGATERALARVALEWAAAGNDPLSDALFALRPCAWMSVQAGGRDPLVQALLEEANPTPCLAIDTDVDVQRPFDSIANNLVCELASCSDFEEEAQRAAAQVLACLREGQVPVAVVAQDREGVRRLRALLARRQVPLHDETGWTLSTTRAAASLMSLLRGLREGASSDQVLEWLKATPEASAPSSSRLEAGMRKQGWASARAVDVSRLDPSVASLWQDVRRLRAQAVAPMSRTLADWLAWLGDTLASTGQWAALQGDAAGTQVLRALRLAPLGGDDIAWHDAAGSVPMSLAQLTRFVDTALEQESFLPDVPSGDAQVVITPLARAMLRPFAAVICPAADEKRLGHGGAPLPLLFDSQAQALGLESAARRRSCELLAFAQLLRTPRVSFLRRLRDEDEALAVSPLVERLALAMRRGGREMEVAEDVRRLHEVAAAPVPHPLPVASALLPQALGASAIEALRECPYRFFALHMLRLRDAQELDDGIEKRDYGSWLHAVLHRFHRDRKAGADDFVQLASAAATEREALGLDEAAFLPFAAQFERLIPRYIEWLHTRDAAGARWLEGESEISASNELLSGIELRGRIDRIDSVQSAHGSSLQLIDYKTGSTIELKRRIRQQPAEDTQLAVYAALVLEQAACLPAQLEACYLPLDDSQALQPIEHPQVEATARLLLHGLGADLQRIRAGAALPALGEGNVCGYCEARGLCRRDDWASP